MKTYGRGRRETGTCLRPSLVPCSPLTPLSAAVLLSQAADTDTADTAKYSDRDALLQVLRGLNSSLH